MVKPTRLHYFFAQGWPATILLVVVLSIFVSLAVLALGPAPQLVGFGAEARSYLFLLGIALLIGLCVSALLGPFILGPIYDRRAALNGAPFHIGDRVEVLVGRNRGSVARVSEVWESRGSLRVEWDNSVARQGRTTFGFAQVIKVSEADLPVASDAWQAARR